VTVCEWVAEDAITCTGLVAVVFDVTPTQPICSASASSRNDKRVTIRRRFFLPSFTAKPGPINSRAGNPSHSASPGPTPSCWNAGVRDAFTVDVIVSTEFAGLDPGVNDAGENEHVIPFGTCGQVSETGVSTEVIGVTVTLNVGGFEELDPPIGATFKLKSGFVVPGPEAVTLALACEISPALSVTVSSTV